MEFDVVIPTYIRVDKAKECIEKVSLAREHAMNTFPILSKLTCYVWVSTDEELSIFSEYYSGHDWIKPYLLDNFYDRAPIDWDKHIRNTESDWIHFLMDDQHVNVKSYACVVDSIVSKSINSVIGMYIDNYPDHFHDDARNGGSIIINKKFCLNTFGDKPIFCPDYYRWIFDCEFATYVKSIGKFHYIRQATLSHYHPSVTPEKRPDDCYFIGRFKIMPHDLNMCEMRKKAGLLWGKNFDLITKETVDGI